MAKKRIAADVDLCGNSVENVKNVTASGTVKADTLEGALKGEMLEPVRNKETVAALPYYNYTLLGLSTSATNDEYVQALLKKLVSEHGNLLGMTLIGKTEPNSQRNVILYTYTSTLNGMPKYCSGIMCEGYAGGVYSFWINNGVFGSKTIVGSTGNLLGAKTDHVGNEIATTYATKSEVNNKVTKNNPDGVQAYEGNLKFGTGSVAGSVNPLDMALIPGCGANRFAFLPPECITIEYSRDAGATWLDYGASDAVKRRIVSNHEVDNVKLGGPDASASNPADENCRLRITIKQKGSGLYASLRKFYAQISTSGSTGCWWKIYGRNNASASNESGWIPIANECKLSGWSGPNIINTGSATFGAGDSQFGELRFEFGATGHDGSAYYGLSIYNIFAYGASAWRFPSEMAKTGHLYSYDYAQNATFPNGVTAKSFMGNLVGRANNALMDADNNNISATYLKKTDAESTYATKTTTNGLQSQISSMVAKTQKLSSDGSTYSGKAVNDGEGNNISETYAKKTELPTASDGFYSAPKLITASSDNATGGMILSIDHPCKGVSGVEFVLMTKTKRMRCGYNEASSKKTKDTKRGWTVAQNFRRAAMSYGDSHPQPCVLNDVLDNYNAILQYVRKYYMYPFNTTATAVQTTNIPVTNLYFGGWNMTSKQKTAKVFGIAARRLKSDGKYEYSQPAAIKITKTERSTLAIGIL